MSLLELPQLQDRPRLFSTFLMWLLADLFEELPEVGDIDKPKLVFFFDEAHLLFDDASKEFLEAIAQTVRLIRSKGVGVFFVTQTPEGRAGGRAGPARQPGAARAAGLHARRREGAQGHRVDLPQLLLRPGGDADPARHRRGHHHGALRPRCADAGRLDPAARPAVEDGAGRPGLLTAAVAASPLHAKYAEQVDRESAYERLAARLEKPPAEAPTSGTTGKAPKAPTVPKAPKVPKAEKSTAEKVLESSAFKQAARSAAAVIGREITRSIFGTRRR